MSDNSAKVCIVIVNYNTADDVQRCVASLTNLSFQDYFVVVVDNHSPDGSGELLRDSISGSNIEVILHKENNGFAAGANIGIRRGLALGAQYIWLLNPDIEVRSGALTSLVNAFEESSEIAVAGSKVLYGDGAQNVIWSSGGFANIAKKQTWMRGTGELDEGQYDQQSSCDYVPGCALFARASVFSEHGLLPEKYFMYYEETDWCLCVKGAGLELRYIPESVVLHHCERDKMQAPFIVYYYNRNERLFWFRFGTIPKRVGRWLRSLCIELPKVLRSYLHARGTAQEYLFYAHFRSVADAVFFQTGRCKKF